MNEITRKKNTGETGNGGEFGTHKRTECSAALTTTAQKLNGFGVTREMHTYEGRNSDIPADAQTITSPAGREVNVHFEGDNIVITVGDDEDRLRIETEADDQANESIDEAFHEAAVEESLGGVFAYGTEYEWRDGTTEVTESGLRTDVTFSDDGEWTSVSYDHAAEKLEVDRYGESLNDADSKAFLESCIADVCPGKTWAEAFKAHARTITDDTDISEGVRTAASRV